LAAGEIPPHGAAKEIVSDEYLASLQPSNCLRLGTYRCNSSASVRFPASVGLWQQGCLHVSQAYSAASTASSSADMLEIAITQQLRRLQARPRQNCENDRTAEPHFSIFGVLRDRQTKIGKCGKLSGGTHLEPAIEGTRLASASSKASPDVY
jgi:hypothetical protein